MAKPSNRSPERKLQVVLSVLRGEQSVAGAAHHGSPSDQHQTMTCLKKP